jgi:hypothetical protein
MNTGHSCSQAQERKSFDDRLLPLPQRAGIFAHPVPQIHDQFLGRQRLPGGVGWAGCLAATTFRAGVAVQQLFPGELLDGAHAQRLLRLLDILDLGDGARWVEAAEEHIGRRADDVQKLGVGSVAIKPNVASWWAHHTCG